MDCQGRAGHGSGSFRDHSAQYTASEYVLEPSSRLIILDAGFQIAQPERRLTDLRNRQSQHIQKNSMSRESSELALQTAPRAHRFLE